MQSSPQLPITCSSSTSSNRERCPPICDGICQKHSHLCKHLHGTYVLPIHARWLSARISVLLAALHTVIGSGGGLFAQASFSVAQAIVDPQMVASVVDFITFAVSIGQNSKHRSAPSDC
jgi:hypothetical protein